MSTNERATETADPRDAVCDEIRKIMATYREQQASARGVGTPGGLEHMGDVWRLLRKWDGMLSGAKP